MSSRGREGAGASKSRLAGLARVFEFRESGILLALLVMCVLLAVFAPDFRSGYNLMTVVRQFSLIAIVSMGQTLVIISGGFDLSLGAIAGLSAIAAGILMGRLGQPVPVAVAAGLAVGTACAFFNGLLITRVRLHPVVVTLGTTSVFKGITYVITLGRPVLNLPKSFLFLGQGFIGVVPVPVILMIVVGLAVHIVLTRSVFGRRIYALGSNREAARLSGIKVDRTVFGIYGLAGFLAALSGVAFVGRLGSAMPTIGQTWLLPSIAAPVIGGASLAGGEGTVLGTVIGAAIMGVVDNALVIMGVNIYWQDVVIGAVILAAVTIDEMRRRLRTT